MDDYENDFDDFDFEDKTQQKRVSPIKNTSINSGYKPSVPAQSNSRINNFKKEEEDDDEDDYDDDFEEVGNKDKKPSYNATNNTKPLGLNNKPDWLKKTNPNPVSVGSKPVIGGSKSSLNNNSISKPLRSNVPNSRKTDSVSENRGGSNLNNYKAHQSSVSKNEYGNTQNSKAKANVAKKRDFSVNNQVPKSKKINLPKDYLDKYTKNNPVKILENSLKSIKENIKSLQDELVDSRSITNDAKRQKVLQRINKELRSELKKLSENSTTL